MCLSTMLRGLPARRVVEALCLEVQCFYKSPDMCYMYSYPTSNPTVNYPKPYNPIDPFKGTLLLTPWSLGSVTDILNTTVQPLAETVRKDKTQEP